MSTRESLASLTPDVNWLRLWDDAGDYGLPGAKALMANLRNLTIPKFENYFATFMATSWIPSNLQPITLPVPTSAALLITSGTCCWKHLHSIHLNIMLHIPGLLSFIIFYAASLFICAIPCWSCRYELLIFYTYGTEMDTTVYTERGSSTLMLTCIN